MPRLLRLAHTLKGAARVVKQLEIANLAHQLEDLLVPLREGRREATAEESQRLLGLVDEIAHQVLGLAPAPVSPASAAVAESTRAPKPKPSGARRSGAGRNVGALGDRGADGRRRGARLPARQRAPFAARIEAAAEAWPSSSATPRSAPAKGRRSRRRRNLALAGQRARAEPVQAGRELVTNLEQATRELGQVRDGIDRLRLVAAASIFGTLERTARDAAVSLGKQALFEAKGDDVKLEAEVLTAVQRALVQAVRNAVAHGIESAAERRALANQPKVG